MAPPRDGVNSWLIRRVHIGTPATVAPGSEVQVSVSLVEAHRGQVATAPPDPVPYMEKPVDIEWELRLEGASLAGEGSSHGQLRVNPKLASTRMSLGLVASQPLPEGVDVAVRFFLGPYEVGRARAFVPSSSGQPLQLRPGSPGALVVPDTLIESTASVLR